MANPGEEPGGGGADPTPSFLDQTEVQRAEKSFFESDGRFCHVETNLRLNGTRCLTHDKTGENLTQMATRLRERVVTSLEVRDLTTNCYSSR